MTRWNWKRWACAIVAGTALVGSFTSAASDDKPKAGESITLKFPGQPDRVVTVVSSVRKADGSLETEVKDAKTGDTFTLIDPAPENKLPAPAPPKPVATVPVPAPAPVVTPALPPLPKPVATKSVAPPAPLPPLPTVAAKPPVVKPDLPVAKAPMAGTTAIPPMVQQADKRLIPNTPAAAAATPAAPTVEEKRPGILGRIFGKKPTPQMMPATSMPQPTPVASTTTPAPLPSVRTNAEPPRVQQPVKPVTPPAALGKVERVVAPTPVVPPSSLPVALPSKPLPPVNVTSIPTPPPIAVPSIPTPPSPPATPTIPPPIAVPSIPTPPPIAVPSIPSIPVKPAVEVKPLGVPEVVKPVAHTPMAQSVDSLALTLKDAAAPSARLRAAKELATGVHASTDAAKAVLFNAAKSDPCPAVQADCIEHLAKLGYRDPAFVEFVKASCTSESGEVRIAAKTAMEKLAK